MEEIITSFNNPTIKLLRSLHIKKYRDMYGLYFAEGPKLVKEALDTDYPIHTLIYSRNFPIKELNLELKKRSTPTICVEDNVYKQLSDVETPQGVMVILRKKINSPNAILQQDKGFWVVLDRIQDPGNMGTIIRTIDAVGGNGVVLLKGCVDPYNPKTVRATMGSILRVPIVEIKNNSDFLRQLTAKQADILISSMEGTSVFNWQSGKGDAIKALVIGNESQGIDSEIREFATDTISVPIVGGAESLNASVAAGIMIYEMMRKEGNLG
ncbi:MAG: RNA methyltransferase [Clostridiales bacterium]|nr:RNA methyltransferase [Clostridiales bacterium]